MNLLLSQEPGNGDAEYTQESSNYISAGGKIISYFIGKTTINILLINSFASFKEDYKFSGPNETPRAPGHGHVSKYNEVLNRRQIIFYLKIFNNFIISNNHNTLVNPI